MSDQFPTVITPQERGAIGHARMVANTTKAQRDAWARRGGRKRNRTLAEIEADAVVTRQRTPKRRSARKGTPIAHVSTRFS